MVVASVRGLASTFLDLGRDIVKAFSQKIIMQLLVVDGGTGTSEKSGGGGFLAAIKKTLGNVFGGGSGQSRHEFGRRGFRYFDRLTSGWHT